MCEMESKASSQHTRRESGGKPKGNRNTHSFFEVALAGYL